MYLHVYIGSKGYLMGARDLKEGVYWRGIVGSAHSRARRCPIRRHRHARVAMVVSLVSTSETASRNGGDEGEGDAKGRGAHDDAKVVLVNLWGVGT